MINIKHNRINLQEGRSRGLGFAFLKKIDKNNYETVQPISPCKDYLNDVLYAENFQATVNAYGLNYTFNKIFDEYNYLVLRICPAGKKNPDDVINYPEMQKEIELLQNNYKYIQNVLNEIEIKLKINQSTITKIDDRLFLVKLSNFWTSNTYLISLYSLLIRISLIYTGSISVKDFLNTYENGTTYLHNQDKMLWLNAKFKLYLILKGIAPKQKKVEGVLSTNIHNAGIVACTEYDIELL